MLSRPFGEPEYKYTPYFAKNNLFNKKNADKDTNEKMHGCLSSQKYIHDNYRDKSKSKHVFFSIFSAIIV